MEEAPCIVRHEEVDQEPLEWALIDEREDDVAGLHLDEIITSKKRLVNIKCYGSFLEVSSGVNNQHAHTLQRGDTSDRFQRGLETPTLNLAFAYVHVVDKPNSFDAGLFRANHEALIIADFRKDALPDRSAVGASCALEPGDLGRQKLQVAGEAEEAAGERVRHDCSLVSR